MLQVLFCDNIYWKDIPRVKIFLWKHRREFDVYAFLPTQEVARYKQEPMGTAFLFCSYLSSVNKHEAVNRVVSANLRIFPGLSHGPRSTARNGSCVTDLAVLSQAEHTTTLSSLSHCASLLQGYPWKTTLKSKYVHCLPGFLTTDIMLPGYWHCGTGRF